MLAGVILVGTCPGGTSSNVITYLSKGDVAFSGGMTSVNTLLAPILTPAITYLLLNTTVEVDMLNMFVSIVKVVIVPIALGFIVNHFFEKHMSKVAKALPIVSITAISLASASFSNLAMATVPGAIFSVWHNISGAVLASIYKRIEK